MVVSAGNIHTLLQRTTIQNPAFRNEVEVLEGTFNYYKIEMKGLLHPLKIYLKYLSMPENQLYGDIKVFTSTMVDKPDENCF
jgi:hypothetical protein